MNVFESPQSFARACVRVALALAVLGISGLLDPVFMLPLAGVLLAFAALAWLAGADLVDDPPLLDEPPLVDDPPLLDELPLLDEPVDPAPAVATPPIRVTRTFRLPASVGAEHVWVVGDFNDWSHTAHPMRRVGDWFTISIELEPGTTYRYRYLLDGDRWENDWDADEYVKNDFGTDDSLART